MSNNQEALAQAFINAHWQHIADFVWSHVWPHHIRHEPGGDDPIHLDLDELENVNMTGKADGDVPVWSEASGKWEPGAGGGGGGPKIVHFGAKGAITASNLAPGPYNVSGAAKTLQYAYVTADDAVTVDIMNDGVSAATIALVAAGADDATFTSTWDDGTQVDIALSDIGDNLTSLTVDIRAA